MDYRSGAKDSKEAVVPDAKTNCDPQVSLQATCAVLHTADSVDTANHYSRFRRREVVML